MKRNICFKDEVYEGPRLDLIIEIVIVMFDSLVLNFS